LRVTPSKLASADDLSWLLSSMGQFPFNPPSVGGWPYDDAWLTAAAIQYRVDLASTLVQKGDLTPLTSVPKSEMVQAAANWLGVAQWSNRTKRALTQALSDPSRVAFLAINAPEYLVNA
jgi:uncharacterized protein (DUF1800 family)